MEQATSQIDFFAIIELMGHQKIAGKVTEQPIAGTNMLRVDVPKIGSQPAFTRYIGGSGIYAINPCTEEVLHAFLKSNQPTPVYAWDVSQMIKEERLRLKSASPAPAAGEEEITGNCHACDKVLTLANSCSESRDYDLCDSCFPL